MASTLPSYRTGITTGVSGPVVMATWPSLAEGIESFLQMCESVDVTIGEHQFKILLTLFFAGSRTDRFQVISTDLQTVVHIERITVGIPTPNER